MIEDVLVADCNLHLRNSKLHLFCGGNFDLRGAADLSRALFEHDIPALYFHPVRRPPVRGFQLTWDGTLPEFFTHGIDGEEFQDVVLQGFEGRQAKTGNRAPPSRCGTAGESRYGTVWRTRAAGRSFRSNEFTTSACLSTTI
ncbi:MAG: hypothetical protein ACUVXB_05650 [Bryobacteraceae bacterium]